MKWYDKLIEAIRKWFDKTKPDPKPEPEKPRPDDTAIPAGDSSEALQGFSHPTPITDRIAFRAINEGNIYWTGAPVRWASGELVGECHAGVLRNGRWVTAKYDHIRANTTQRDFKNIHSGYGRWSEIGEPKTGETVAFFCISYDKTKRTNAIFANWK